MGLQHIKFTVGGKIKEVQEQIAFDAGHQKQLGFVPCDADGTPLAGYDLEKKRNSTQTSESSTKSAVQDKPETKEFGNKPAANPVTEPNTGADNGTENSEAEKEPEVKDETETKEAEGTGAAPTEPAKQVSKTEAAFGALTEEEQKMITAWQKGASFKEIAKAIPIGWKKVEKVCKDFEQATKA